MTEKEIYAKIGSSGFERLTSHFYRRMREDQLVGSLYPENDWEGAEERLRDFLLFRFGGAPDYLEKRGHPRLRMRHQPYLIGEKERDRWMEIMDEAMRDSAFPEDVQRVLHQFFFGVADFMRNH